MDTSKIDGMQFSFIEGDFVLSVSADKLGHVNFDVSITRGNWKASLLVPTALGMLESIGKTAVAMLKAYREEIME